MDCNGVKQHLVDFLYDDMPAEARAAFVEHVHACAACKADIASYEATLGNARAALSGPLASDPPARVRDAVIRAATAAAAKPASAAQKSREVRKATESEPGFFARILRAPWLLPAFGAVSVATVVFLVRVLKNPEVIPGQRPQPVEERAEPAQAAAPIAKAAPAEATPQKADRAPAAAAETGLRVGGSGAGKAPEAAIRKRKEVVGSALSGLLGQGRGAGESGIGAASGREKKKPDNSSLGDTWQAGTGSGASSAGRFAEPPPPRQAPKGAPAADQFRSSPPVESDRPGEAAKDEEASPLRARKARGIDDLDLTGELRSHRPAAGPAKQMAVPKSAEETAKPAAPAATPPAAAPSPAPAPVAVAVPMPSTNAISNHAAKSEPEAPSPAPAGAVVQAPTAPKPAVAPAARRRAEKRTEEPPQAAEEKSGDDKMVKAQPGPSLDESVRRADRLFASQSWSAAAEAYRDLLRRFPGHKDAAKWRQRIDQALVADRESRDTDSSKTVKAKKATSADALDGLKQ